MAEVKKSSSHSFAVAGLEGKSVVLTVNYESDNVTLKDQDDRDITIEGISLATANAWQAAIAEALTFAGTLTI